MSAGTAALEPEWHRLDPRMLLVHPIKELVKFLPVLLGLLIAGGFTDGPRALIGVGVPVTLGVVRYLTTTYRVTATTVELRRGLLDRHSLSTPVDRVRTVDLTASPIHRLLGLATLVIGTGSVTKDKDERLVLDALPRPEAAALRTRLLAVHLSTEGYAGAPAVHDAVQRVLDSGAHVVLSSGRAPHNMTAVADMLDLHGHGERLWIVAANGAVVLRYPPAEVVHEVTFDAAPAVAAVLAQHPEALVAVEERGVGYRVSAPFPDGELGGESIVAAVEDMVSRPVSRVIIRDPKATAEDFVKLAGSLGLHGTDYVVGWTAWLDLAPVGVSKASGLQHVCDAVGLSADDALAIGDGRNDLEMLAWARRGVAMGQAIEEVRAAADDVTGRVDEDGAATELGRWF